MGGKKNAGSRFLITLLATIDICLCFVYLLNYFIGTPFESITAIVDLDGESSIGTWFSSTQLFLIALFLGIFAYFKIDRRDITSWLLPVLPLVFLFFSLDEIAMIHERIGFVCDSLLKSGTRQGTLFHHTGIWIIFLGLFFIVFITFLLIVIKSHFKGKKIILIKISSGIALFLCGAVGVELLDNLVCNNATLHVLEVSLEEFLEMFGTTIVCWGAWDLASDYVSCKPLGPGRETIQD